MSSKLFQLFRKSDITTGFDARNTNKNTVEVMNEVFYETNYFRYEDSCNTENVSPLSLQFRGFASHLYTQGKKFILPETFPLAAETTRAGFQRFKLPMVRNINGFENVTGNTKTQIENLRNAKIPSRVVATHNYVGYEFYPFVFWLDYDWTKETPSITSVPQCPLIAFDAGNCKKIRVWKTGEFSVSIGSDYGIMKIIDELDIVPVPLFEQTVIPFQRNYIYLTWNAVTNHRDVISTGSTLTDPGDNYRILIEFLNEDREDFCAQTPTITRRDPNDVKRRVITNVSEEYAISLYANEPHTLNDLLALRLEYNEGVFPNGLSYPDYKLRVFEENATAQTRKVFEGHLPLSTIVFQPTHKLQMIVEKRR